MTNNFNFNPALSFDGSNDGLYMNYNAGISSNTVTVFSVFSKTGGAGYQSPFTARHENTTTNVCMGYNLYLDGSNQLEFWSAKYTTNMWSILAGNTETLNYPVLLSVDATAGNGTSSQTLRQKALQTNTSATKIYQVQDIAFQPQVGYGINTGTTPDYFLQGKVNEILDFDYVMTAAEKLKIESYLALKYGITLGNTTTAVSYVASDGTTKWNGNVTYQIDIGGIGRDDAFGLNQKQSKSVNSTAIVTMALGSIAATNAANVNTFAADKSFLIWGHTNQALDASGISDMPAAIKARLARTWKIQESGTMGSVKIRFDASTIPGATGPGTNDLNSIRLLVDNDGVFADASVIDKTTYNNTTDIIEFDYDFPAGTSYFTLGSVSLSSAPLPIELVSFRATETEQGVKLCWETASERNNEKFEIQKSTDARHWSVIGTVSGNGTTALASSYSFFDTNTVAGIQYYRLQQTDYNGISSVSKVVSVNIEKVRLWVYPNPASDFVWIQGQASDFDDLRIYNSLGLEQNARIQVSTTNNNFIQINVSTLESGLYYMKLANSSTLFYKGVK